MDNDILSTVLGANKTQQSESQIKDTSTQTQPKHINLRPSLSSTTATKFVPVFDLLIDKFGQDETFVPCAVSKDRSGVPVKPQTLRHQLNEGLLYLCQFELDNAEKKCKYKLEDYRRLRVAIRFCLTFHPTHGAGVMCRYKLEALAQSALASNAEDILGQVISITDGRHGGGNSNSTDTLDEPRWKKALTAFIEDDSRRILILSGAKDLGTILTAEDIEWTKRLLLQVDIECEVTSMLIKAIK